MHWKLWYADGSTFSDVDGSWAEAPWRGVQALTVINPDIGWWIETGSDGRVQAYAWLPDEPDPFGLDHYGIIDLLFERGLMSEEQAISEIPVSVLQDAGIKLGRSMSTPAFNAIIDRAREDPDLPVKSARMRHERPA